MAEEGTEPKRDARSILLKAIPIAVVIVLLLSTVIFFINLNGGSLDYSKSEILFVPTGSMDGEPQDYPISTIPVDSIIMVHRLSDDQKSELVVGDVVTFHQGGIYKVHRIIDISGDTVTTKGDANQFPDPAIQLSDIDGEVVGVAPTVGKIVSTVRDAMLGSPLLIIIAIVIIIVMIYSIIEIINIFRNKDEED